MSSCLACVSWNVSKALKVETKDAGSGLGTGGMSTKILAARTASVSGSGELFLFGDEST